MLRIVTGFLVLVLALPALADGDDSKDKAQEKPATPAQQFLAIQKEHQAAMQIFQKAVSEAKTNEERQKVFAEKYPQPAKFAPKFLELAEKNPNDPVAVDALVWIVMNSQGSSGKDNPQTKAMEILLRDHFQSEKLGQICQMLTFRIDKQSEQLCGLLEKSPSKDVQGKACLALAQYLRNRKDTLERIKDRPEMAKFYEGSLDKDYFKELRDQDPVQVTKDIETLFERATKEFADVKLQFYGTVGSKAKAELYDLRFLTVGKVAPDVEGQDQDGKKFKLSDYRGKVVLLDFWSQF